MFTLKERKKRDQASWKGSSQGLFLLVWDLLVSCCLVRYGPAELDFNVCVLGQGQGESRGMRSGEWKAGRI